MAKKKIRKRSNGKSKQSFPSVLRGWWNQLTKELDSTYKTVEKRVKKNDVFKNTQKVIKNLDKNVEQARNQFLGALGLASKNEIDKLNRKINTISRKVNGLSRA